MNIAFYLSLRLIDLEATALDDKRSFIHLAYAYGFTTMSKLVMPSISTQTRFTAISALERRLPRRQKKGITRRKIGRHAGGKLARSFHVAVSVVAVSDALCHPDHKMQ